MSYQSEAQLESKLIESLKSKGYDKVVIKDSKELEENFRVQIQKFNSPKFDKNKLTDSEFKRLMTHVDNDSIHKCAKKLRDKYDLTRDDGTTVYVEFFSEEWSKNIFQVTNQVTMVGSYKNRYDVTIIANGLPLIQIELKRRGLDIKEAFNQIMRYRKHSLYVGLYKYTQIFVISNGVDTKYFSNSDKETVGYENTFYWTNDQNDRITNMMDFSNEFLTKKHVNKMISKYMVIRETTKDLMVMRPYQIFATEALVKKAIDTTGSGYIWHTTGSGKTLTSFKASQILADEPSIKKIIFLVDRLDLDNQTSQEFNNYQEGSVDDTDSTKVLVKQLQDKNNKLIITTIQKMAYAVKSPKYNGKITDLKSEKVIFVIDECHRSQHGEMHRVIKKHFEKSQYFGFTGTPRFPENKSIDGRTTAEIFGECLHTYLIREAIHDNNVLGFNVEYVKTIDGDYDDGDDSMVYDIDREEIFEDSVRMTNIANHIVKHHNMKTRNRKYTALFATSKIKNAITYYDLFKNIDHELRIATVYSFGTNEEEGGQVNKEHSRDSMERIIKDYNKMFATNYSTDQIQSYNADVSSKVKSAQIDILIVVNMYLTGFDSKPLNTLYVDKNLKYHDLLQAFSRTNRVETLTKPYGNIICYRNIKKRTDEAIMLFSQTDNVDDVLLKEYNYYKDKFIDKVADLKEVAKKPSDVDKILEEDIQHKFITRFKDLSQLLLTMQSFIEFEFDEDQLTISEVEYLEYKSKYFNIYDRVKRTDIDKVSVLSDVDFSIELMHTDRINVMYIMNLIRNIDFDNDKNKKKDIENIKTELERTDSSQLRMKIELLKKFLDDVASYMTGEDNVDEKYYEFESKERYEEIKRFAESNNLDTEFIEREVSEMEFSGVLDRTRIREGVYEQLNTGLIATNTLLSKIINFIKEHTEKYQ